MRRHMIVCGELMAVFFCIVMLVWYREGASELGQSTTGPTEPFQQILPAPAEVDSFPAVDVVSSTFPEPAMGNGGVGEAVSSIVASENVYQVDNSRVLADETLDNFVRAILDPAERIFERLECPLPQGLERYETLKANSIPRISGRIKYFFALDLTQCVDLLPRLLGSVVETLSFLGPENCALSIVEGNSDDGTPEVLKAIAVEIEALGTEYFLQTTSIDPKAGAEAGGNERIVRLANLRNLAMQPMVDNTLQYNADTTVVFLNDVAICMEDILELVYQRALLGADMTCAMDWMYAGANPTFYDVWISRTISGESFFKILENKSWELAWNLFWSDPDSKKRFAAHLPFQVFSCWNGAVTFTAEPFLNAEVSFRSNKPGECYQGEPELLCKDFWHAGYGKIAVVPSVNLEYTDDRGKAIKALKGYTSQWIGPGHDERSKIDWIPDPPEQVKCMELLEKAEWRPWNETLG